MLLENIKTIAKSKNIPIYQLEKTLDIADGSICKWDKVKPSYDKVVRCAQTLGVTVEDLLKE